MQSGTKIGMFFNNTARILARSKETTYEKNSNREGTQSEKLGILK